jgi:hypothetical protein
VATRLFRDEELAKLRSFPEITPIGRGLPTLPDFFSAKTLPGAMPPATSAVSSA